MDWKVREFCKSLWNISKESNVPLAASNRPSPPSNVGVSRRKVVTEEFVAKIKNIFRYYRFSILLGDLYYL
jgi:hypothetical protein